MHDRHGSLPLPPSMHACNPVGYILGSNLTPESLRAAAAMVGGLIDYTCHYSLERTSPNMALEREIRVGGHGAYYT